LRGLACVRRRIRDTASEVVTASRCVGRRVVCSIAPVQIAAHARNACDTLRGSGHGAADSAACGRVWGARCRDWANVTACTIKIHLPCLAASFSGVASASHITLAVSYLSSYGSTIPAEALVSGEIVCC
jgi:hypothetical protein